MVISFPPGVKGPAPTLDPISPSNSPANAVSFEPSIASRPLSVMAASAGAKSAVGKEFAAAPPQGPWYKRRHLIKLNFIIASLTLFSSSSGYDGSLMNNLQALTQWKAFMNNPTGAWLGFMNAIYWLGVGVSYPPAAIVANNYGRKLGVWIGYLLLALGAGLQAAANNEAAFITARFFLGCASAWFGNCVPLLINEIAYPAHRGICNALFMCGWYFGGTVASFVTFGTRQMVDDWSWRIPSLCQVLIPLLALPGFLMAPQSPRWLVSVDQSVQAQKILTEYHGGGDENSRLVKHELFEITTTIKAEDEANSSASYMDMTRTPGNRKRLWISVSLGFYAQWVGNGVVSYYLSLVLDSVGVTSVTSQTLIAACLQVWNLIICVGAAFSVDMLGRRVLFFASAAIMLVSYIMVTGFSGAFASSGNSSIGMAVIPFLFLFFAGYDVALTPFLVAYPCEIWPFRLRSRGLTVTWVSTVCATFFNTFVNPVALETIGWKYYIVFIVVLILFAITIYFTYPETRGHTLEQMAVVFDGYAADVSPPAEEAQKSASVMGVIQGKSPISYSETIQI